MRSTVRLGITLALGMLSAPWLPRAEAAAATRIGVPRVKVAWHDPSSCARGLAEISRGEIARLLGRMDVALVWRAAGTGDVAPDDELALILIEGSRPGGDSSVLAASLRLPGRCPVVWVYVRSLRGVLACRPEPPLRLPLVERHALGVAVGRVAVHEIVHAVAPEVAHGRGLMASRFNGASLAAPIEITADVPLAMREALRPRPIE